MCVLFFALVGERDVFSEDARVLPKGVNRFAFTLAATGPIHDQYNGSGSVEGIVSKYSTDLNAATLSKVAPSLKQLVGMLNNNQLDGGDSLTAGRLEINGTGYRQQYVFTEQYGLTDKLSLGFQIPIVHVSVNIKKGFSGTNNANSLMQYAPTAEGKAGLQQVANMSIPFIESQIADLGYAPVTSYDKQGIGDIAFGGRYSFHQDERWAHAVQLGTTAPTGAVPEPNDLAGIPFGEGAWDIGAAHVMNWSPVSWLTLGQGLHYTYKLADNQRKRVPSSPDDILPGADSERLVRRKMGDKAWTTASIDWTPSKTFLFEAAYEWYWRFQDKFYELDGRSIDSLNSGMHYTETVSLQFKFSTIDMYLKKKFPVPVDFLLTGYHPVRGKNVTLVDFATAELALYF